MDSISSEEETELIPAEADSVGLEWDVDMEIQLFYAMANHKPVGINKYFHMACIYEKLSSSITKEITTRDIWKHLGTLYDMALLDETEPTPFPNKEVPFSLPESEFGELMRQKCKETIVMDESEGCHSPSPKESTPKSSSSKGTASKDSTPKATPMPAMAVRKDSVSAVPTKARKESGSSHASTDTPSIKSEYERRRDSRDSNASGTKEGSSRKSISQKDKVKLKGSPVISTLESPSVDEDSGRRGRRRANTSTPPAIVPTKRRRT